VIQTCDRKLGNQRSRDAGVLGRVPQGDEHVLPLVYQPPKSLLGADAVKTFRDPVTIGVPQPHMLRAERGVHPPSGGVVEDQDPGQARRPLLLGKVRDGVLPRVAAEQIV
jgi:hypothetical protein